MKNLQAKMFNKKAGDPKNKPNQIIQAIALQTGQNIADIGSGGGYFSLRFAELVGNVGKVYAVDTNSDLLAYVKNCAKEKDLANIVTIITAQDRLDLPEKNLDYIFMRNMTHHLSKRVEYFRSLKKFLKANGKVAIIEYERSKPFTFRGIFGHRVPKEIIINEMKEAGYSLARDFNFLPEQNFTIWQSLN